MSAIYAKDVLDLLKKHGFIEISERTRGDHHRYIDGKGHNVSVPYTSKKDVIRKGTYNNILKQMGVK